VDAERARVHMYNILHNIVNKICLVFIE
jgi:hypothetical protein